LFARAALSSRELQAAHFYGKRRLSRATIIAAEKKIPFENSARALISRDEEMIVAAIVVDHNFPLMEREGPRG